jgi:hypothetical protein
MLHLFRFIRKDLIQVNNVKKYILYAFGEILLIVVGILIAVQIGNWNQERKDRSEEREILTRISNEVAGHVVLFSNIFFPDLAEAKAALDQVAFAFEGEPIADNVAFLNSVVKSGTYGYFTPRFQSTTYDELVSSGKLQLIRMVELRDLISKFYLINFNYQKRGEALKGNYGLFTVDLVPRGEGDINAGIDVLSEEAAAEVVASVLESDLHRFIIPQRNRLKFLQGMWTEQMELANKLLAEIDAELEGR